MLHVTRDRLAFGNQSHYLQDTANVELHVLFNAYVGLNRDPLQVGLVRE